MKPEIILSGQCKNSPKNQRVETLAVALLVGDTKAASTLLSHDCVWHLADGQTLTGEDIHVYLTQRQPPGSVTITHVITHGNSGAVNARLNIGNTQYRQCDIFDFTNAKGQSIKQITTYRTLLD